ncbi:MAG TPA: hypothetical protein ENH88_19340 [Pseudoalteromonas prydzensis]|uniref:Transposase DDE domain-containing protein n=1 Tax=Pseudoalteromonas prydzensis TaxID=182141 RepID=A0A7V1D275_9GAMM|nr:transposase [Pseudoalteromonas prydzensis]HEA18557.1 hypothetical protein [Pseudoalteromonas prydzensis]
MYKYRHLVENAFGRIKQYRKIATQYEKLERNYHSMLALAFTMMWLPMRADQYMYHKDQQSLMT